MSSSRKSNRWSPKNCLANEVEKYVNLDKFFIIFLKTFSEFSSLNSNFVWEPWGFIDSNRISSFPSCNFSLIDLNSVNLIGFDRTPSVTLILLFELPNLSETFSFSVFFKIRILRIMLGQNLLQNWILLIRFEEPDLVIIFQHYTPKRPSFYRWIVIIPNSKIQANSISNFRILRLIFFKNDLNSKTQFIPLSSPHIVITNF